MGGGLHKQHAGLSSVRADMSKGTSDTSRRVLAWSIHWLLVIQAFETKDCILHDSQPFKSSYWKICNSPPERGSLGWLEIPK